MDDMSKDIKRRDRSARHNHRYRVRLKEQLIQAYGGRCSACGIEGGLTPIRQVPLPRGANTYSGYAAARRLGFPEGLYELFCEQHHPNRPDPLANDPALAAWVQDQTN